MKEIKQEEKDLQAEKASAVDPHLTEEQLREIGLERIHARAGEEELIDRWMQVSLTTTPQSFAPQTILTRIEPKSNSSNPSVCRPLRMLLWDLFKTSNGTPMSPSTVDQTLRKPWRDLRR